MTVISVAITSATRKPSQRRIGSDTNFAPNEPTAVGMGRALQQSGKSGKVIAIGFDGNQDLQGFVRDGTIQAIAVQSSYQMGYKGIETIVKVIVVPGKLINFVVR